jgi:hypothetical protein
MLDSLNTLPAATIKGLVFRMPTFFRPEGGNSPQLLWDPDINAHLSSFEERQQARATKIPLSLNASQKL